MFCPNCGGVNADTATVCEQCGQPIPLSSTTQTSPLQAGVPSIPGATGVPPPRIANVPSYLVQSIVMTSVSLFALCCFFGILSLPFAVIALVYSIQVNSKLGMNDVFGAQAASRNAKMFNWISMGAFVLGFALYLFLGLLVVLKDQGGHL